LILCLDLWCKIFWQSRICYGL